MNRKVRCLSSSAPCVLAALVMVGAGLGGCYKRVVRQEPGLGAKRSQVYESNLDRSRVPVIDDWLDKALEPDKSKKKPPRQ